MAAMLLAPFVAQPPGIVIGLTKSAYNPSWPLVDQEATAFSGLTSQLKMTGDHGTKGKTWVFEGSFQLLLLLLYKFT